MIEAPVADVAATKALLPGFTVVESAPVPGQALRRALETSPVGSPAAVRQFCLAGHVGSITALRAVLRANGVERRRIRTHGYWAEGKAGL